MHDAAGWPGTGKLPGTFLWERVINGPVRSRRLGLSLGLNIIPPRSKLCSFDCPYCECGFNTPRAAGEKWPAPDVVADALRKTIGLGGVRPDWVTFAGNGEPTLHPRFATVVERVLETRDEVMPGLRVGVLSNGMHAHLPAVREALNHLDARMMKLDPGPALAVNGRELDREALVAVYRTLRAPVIQAMVVEGEGWSGASAESIGEWLGLLERIEPAAVHLYSLDRAAADPRVRAVGRGRLEEIAARTREIVAGPVLVF
jgi:pyruvate-formate lyase-activating enzyme